MKVQLMVLCFLLSFPFVLVAQENDVQKADSLYGRALAAVKKHQYENALRYLDEGAPYVSQDVSKRYDWLYGYIYEMLGDDTFYDAPMQSCGYYQKSYEYYASSGCYKNAIDVLIYKGDLMVKLNHYSNAVQSLDLALAIAEKYDLPSIEILIEQCELYENLRQYDRVLSLTSRLYRAYAQTVTPESKIRALKQFADVARRQGNYDLAQAYYLEIDDLLPLLEESRRDHYNYVLYYDRHALLRSMKMYEQAVTYVSDHIEEVKRLPQMTDLLAGLYIDLAYDYSELNMSEKSEESIQEAVKLIKFQKWKGEYLASRYKSISATYGKLGQYEKAVFYLDLADNVSCDGSSAVSRGGILFRMGQNHKAKVEYERYSDYVKSVKGERSYDYAVSLKYLANISAFCGEMDLASRYYIDSADLMCQVVSESIPYLSGTSREAFWSQCSSLFLDMTTFGLKARFFQDEFTRAAYNSLLLSKGLLLTSERSLSSVINDSGDSDLVEMYAKCRKMYSDIEVCKAKGDDPERLVMMSDSLNVLENSLMTKVSGSHGYMSFFNVGYSDIQQALKDSEVVVDFTDFNGLKDPDRIYYAAYVYRKGWEFPRLIKVFEEEQLVELLGEGKPAWKLYDKKTSKKLEELLFKPLRRYINSGDIVYWIPSGMLHKVSVESACLSACSEGFDIRRLSSARRIVEERTLSDIRTASLYGGLQYDMTREELKWDLDATDLPVYMYATRSKGHSEGYEPLPQSYEEVYTIEEILKSAEAEVRLYDGKKGTEASFVKMSGQSPDIIHMSTHGFYYTPEEAREVKALSGHKKAMHLSGLVLSGGNTEWTGEATMTDYLGGLLTADDISKLNLSGTDLVVLSACGTGQGEVTAEGVYGLQRAFKKAGTGYVLMTLWHVNDFVAKEFMVEFYRNLISKKMPAPLALNQTKKTICLTYPDPYYWAGYVLLD